MPNSWGAVLLGAPEDLEDWAFALQPPYDPYVEWVDHDGRYAVLKSAAFDILNSTYEVRDRAQFLLQQLQGSMMLRGEDSALTLGPIATFLADGRLSFHHFLAVETGIKIRSRVGRPTITVKDASGNIVPPPPPPPSTAQVWTGLAQQDPLIADLLTHFGRADNWYDIYKTWELAKKRLGGEHKALKKLDVGQRAKVMSSTANFYRHATTERPSEMLELSQAREVLAAIVKQVLQHAADGG